jgi:aminomethyltransferase
LRLEAGLCLYGHDLNEDISPVEANLTWTIGSLFPEFSYNFPGKRRKEEGGFLGSDVVLSQLKSGVSKKRVGFVVQGAPARGTLPLITFHYIFARGSYHSRPQEWKANWNCH